MTRNEKVYNLKTLKGNCVRKSKDESNNDNVVGFFRQMQRWKHCQRKVIQLDHGMV